MSFNALVVGLGQIGMGYDLHLNPAQYVYSHCRALNVHPQFRLLGGVDPDPGRRELFEQSYQLPAFANLDAALDGISPDVVVIATATEQHADTLKKILERTLPKVILCEKPLSYDSAEARFMIEVCQARGVDLFVNYIRRSDPGVIDIRQRLVTGEMKSPAKGTAWYTKGLLHNGSHLLNLLEYWLGPVIAWKRVNSKSVQKSNDAEVDVLVSFEGGTVMFLVAREEAFSIHALDLLMSNGQLRYENGGARIEWRPSVAHPRISGYKVLSEQAEVISTGMDRYQWNVAEQLAAVLTGTAHNLCLGIEALKTLETVWAILEERQ